MKNCNAGIVEKLEVEKSKRRVFAGSHLGWVALSIDIVSLTFIAKTEI